MKNLHRPMLKLLFIYLSILIVSCSKPAEPIEKQEKEIVDTTVAVEDFESGNKTDYNNQSLSLSSGHWIFANALLGATASDKKNGMQSIRMIGDGSVSMMQPVLLGAETTIKISSALFSDGTAGKWILMASNNGAAFEKVGDSINVTTESLTEVSIRYSKSGWTSFAIQKGSGNTLNFDNFSISSTTTAYPAGYIASPVYVYNYSTTPTSSPGDNDHMLLGNPSGASQDAAANPNNYLMANPYYIISYSRARATPNWVSWHLQKSDYGTVSRTDNYQPNATLPDGWYRVMYASYESSGYTRGHNCPSGDRTSSVEANNAVFLMTNMIPQTSANNNTVWNNLETYTRTLSDNGSECYIIMGSYGNKATIDDGRITVPSNIWKVIVVLNEGNNDLTRITANTRVICVNTPNNDAVNSDWKTYRVSLKDIQDATGYNLLSTINPAIKTALLTKVDNLP